VFGIAKLQVGHRYYCCATKAVQRKTTIGADKGYRREKVDQKGKRSISWTSFTRDRISQEIQLFNPERYEKKKTEEKREDRVQRKGR